MVPTEQCDKNTHTLQESKIIEMETVKRCGSNRHRNEATRQITRIVCGLAISVGRGRRGPAGALSSSSWRLFRPYSDRIRASPASEAQPYSVTSAPLISKNTGAPAELQPACMQWRDLNGQLLARQNYHAMPHRGPQHTLHFFALALFSAHFGRFNTNGSG